MAELKLDQIWVEGGDIETGIWEMENKKIQNFSTGTEVDLSRHLRNLELVEYKNDRTLGGTGSAALVGALIAGPLGALAGGLWGGKKNTESIVLCELSDGKKFIAKVQNATLPSLRLLVNSAPNDTTRTATNTSIRTPRSSETRISRQEVQQEAKNQADGCLEKILVGVATIAGIITYKASESWGITILVFFSIMIGLGFLLVKEPKSGQSSRTVSNAPTKKKAEKVLDFDEAQAELQQMVSELERRKKAHLAKTFIEDFEQKILLKKEEIRRHNMNRG